MRGVILTAVLLTPLMVGLSEPIASQSSPPPIPGNSATMSSRGAPGYILAHETYDGLKKYLLEKHECETFTINQVVDTGSDTKLKISGDGRLLKGRISEEWRLTVCGDERIVGLAVVPVTEGAWEGGVVLAFGEKPIGEQPTAPGSVQRASKAATGTGIAAELQMVPIPGGRFQMGDLIGDGLPAERPVHAVTVRPFNLAKYEVTVDQFDAFVKATGYRTEVERDVRGLGCFVLDLAAGKWHLQAGTSWRAPGFEQSAAHPVVCVSWNDAQAFIAWLNRESGRRLRLPSEAEWEFATRAGASSKYYWGSNADDGCQHANGADLTPWPTEAYRWPDTMKCNDGHFYTSPVGSYAANAFGLHDTVGNVAEWIEDCWNESYAGAPDDGSAWRSGDCARRVSRGGDWFNAAPRYGLRVSSRYRISHDARASNQGFRLAEDQ